MTRLRVFIASPGELGQERDRISRVVDELRWFASLYGADLETIRYETHAWPGFGVDAQEVINREIDWGQVNIFIGMMWRRFGSPTYRADSGTEEEFEKAYQCYKSNGRPHIMLYFRQTPFYTDKTEEINQFMKVIHFRDKVEKTGALIWKYDEEEQFERDVRQHLMREIREQAESKKTMGGLVVRSNIIGFQNAEPSEQPSLGHVSTKSFVFVSYVDEDEVFVKNLYAVLTSCGIRVWSDLNKTRGRQTLSPEVQEAIEKAQLVIVVLSRNTVNSPWILKEFWKAQQTEGQSSNTGYRVIPLLLPGVEPTALETLFSVPLRTNPVQCKTGNLIEVLPDLLSFLAV